MRFVWKQGFGIFDSQKVFSCVAFGFLRVRSARKRERSAQRLFYSSFCCMYKYGIGEN
jgi:hypothetical protein